MRAALAPGLALMLAAATPAALAADADCLWRHSGEAERARWLEAYAASPAIPYRVQLPDDRIAALAAACAVPETQHGRIEALIAARVFEVGAGRFWARRTGRAYAIESAWMALSEDDKDQLRRWAGTAIADGRGEEKVFDALPRFAQVLGVADPADPALAQARAFALGRGYRELISD